MTAEDSKAKVGIPVNNETNFQEKTFLVIDDIATLRASLRATISTMGGVRIDMAANGVEAINRLEQRPYDIILCDYDLGGGKDGQQLLEELKHRKLIKYATIFMMVTAERSYEKVVSAVELAPDDYLIKPFAGEVLRLRLERLAQKKNYLVPVFELTESQDYKRAIELCDQLLKAPNQYKIDLVRIKAEVCLVIGDYSTAKALYEQVLAIRDIPWARMGLAKSMFHQKNYSEAADAFKQVTETSPNYMEAYDWMAKSYSAADNQKAAQQALMAATEKSPRMLARRKELGDVAYRNDDLDTAKESYSAVLEYGKNSALTNPEDFSNLSRVHLDQGDWEQALALMNDARKTFKNSPDVMLQGAVMDSLAYQKSGNTEAAEEALEKAIGYFDASDKKQGNISLDIARSCFQLGDEETGKKVMQEFIQSNHENKKAHLHAEDMFKKIGMHDMGKEIISSSSREVIALNNQAVRLAQSGDLKGSVDLLMQAVSKFQGNAVIVLNTIHAILIYLQKNGWNEELGRAAKSYLATAKNQDPTNQKYLMLAGLFKEVTKHYGVTI